LKKRSKHCIPGERYESWPVCMQLSTPVGSLGILTAAINIYDTCLWFSIVSCVKTTRKQRILDRPLTTICSSGHGFAKFPTPNVVRVVPRCRQAAAFAPICTHDCRVIRHVSLAPHGASLQFASSHSSLVAAQCFRSFPFKSIEYGETLNFGVSPNDAGNTLA